MNQRVIVLRMVRSLLENIRRKGTGCCTCEPFVTRYNNILALVKEACKERSSLPKAFVPIENTGSVGPRGFSIMIAGVKRAVRLESCIGNPEAD